MEKIKLVSKGYTITVDSWENDGDHCRTDSMVVEDKEKALFIQKMCNELFSSINSDPQGIGNAFDEEEAKDILLEWVEANQEIKKYIDLDPEEELDEDYYIGFIMDFSYDLMGGGEYYCRVCESCVVTYSPEDVYCEVI